jgi:ferredoxin-thioredoxin reductase catalytic subunit
MAAQNPSGAYFQTNLQRLRKIAEQNGLVFNPNSDWVNQVIRLMTDSKRDAGKYYCPCKQHHPPDPETDAACPCPTLDEETDIATAASFSRRVSTRRNSTSWTP